MQNANERIGQGEKMSDEKLGKEQLKQIQLNNARQEIDNKLLNQKIGDRKRETISIRIEQARRNVEVICRGIALMSGNYGDGPEVAAMKTVLISNLEILKETDKIQ